MEYRFHLLLVDGVDDSKSSTPFASIPSTWCAWSIPCTPWLWAWLLTHWSPRPWKASPLSDCPSHCCRHCQKNRPQQSTPPCGEGETHGAKLPAAVGNKVAPAQIEPQQTLAYLPMRNSCCFKPPNYRVLCSAALLCWSELKPTWTTKNNKFSLKLQS